MRLTARIVVAFALAIVIAVPLAGQGPVWTYDAPVRGRGWERVRISRMAP